MTTIVKLGGSVITDKENRETIDSGALARAADALESVDGRLVLVHGGGSFGHYHADERDITPASGTHDADAALAVHDAMRRLNDAVVTELHERDVPALPVEPLSAAAGDATTDFTLATTPMETMLDEGFVPVLYGDVITRPDRGATVLSGDDIVASLAERLDASHVGVCCNAPGVLDADGEVVDRIESFDPVSDVITDSGATDVAGGMSKKVKSLLAVDGPVQIFGPAALDEFLAGGSPGTRVE